MIGKVIGAMVGERIAHSVGGISKTNGALLGAGAAMVLRRLGPAGLIAAAVGSYALKRHLAKRERAAAAGNTAAKP